MGARYGQHFLTNRGAIGSILARFDARPDDSVIEIGPGRGALTIPLAERTGRLVAIEIDTDLARALAKRLDCPLIDDRSDPRDDPARTPDTAQEGPLAVAAEPLDDGPRTPESGAATEASETTARRSCFVLRADALNVRYDELARRLDLPPEGRLRVLGNLPYSVATALLRRMIEERSRLSDALLMVQKEVADRILASPGTKAYGVISVLIALTCDRTRVLTLEPGSFSPPPKVRSTIVALKFRERPPSARWTDETLLLLLKAAFSERRKKVAANLAKRFAQDRATVVSWLASAGIDPDARAEAVDPDSYAHLAETLPFEPLDPTTH